MRNGKIKKVKKKRFSLKRLDITIFEESGEL